MEDPAAQGFGDVFRQGLHSATGVVNSFSSIHRRRLTPNRRVNPVTSDHHVYTMRCLLGRTTHARTRIRHRNHALAGLGRPRLRRDRRSRRCRCRSGAPSPPLAPVRAWPCSIVTKPRWPTRWTRCDHRRHGAGPAHRRDRRRQRAACGRRGTCRLGPCRGAGEQRGRAARRCGHGHQPGQVEPAAGGEPLGSTCCAHKPSAAR